MESWASSLQERCGIPHGCCADRNGRGQRSCDPSGGLRWRAAVHVSHGGPLKHKAGTPRRARWNMLWRWGPCARSQSCGSTAVSMLQTITSTPAKNEEINEWNQSWQSCARHLPENKWKTTMALRPSANWSTGTPWIVGHWSGCRPEYAKSNWPWSRMLSGKGSRGARTRVSVVGWGTSRFGPAGGYACRIRSNSCNKGQRGIWPHNDKKDLSIVTTKSGSSRVSNKSYMAVWPHSRKAHWACRPMSSDSWSKESILYNQSCTRISESSGWSVQAIVMSVKAWKTVAFKSVSRASGNPLPIHWARTWLSRWLCWASQTVALCSGIGPSAKTHGRRWTWAWGSGMSNRTGCSSGE